MNLALFDVDGPLILDRTQEFFAWANLLPEISGQWSHQCFVETGDWVMATGGLTPDITGPVYQRFLKSQDCPTTQATPGASKAIGNLKQLTKHIATARSLILQKITKDFIKQHVGSFTKYHFGVHWKKAELARDCQAKFVIDDNHHLLNKVASVSNARPILFPSRSKRDLSGLNGVTILKAESRVTENTSLDSFRVICILAWQEIISILQNGHHKR